MSGVDDAVAAVETIGTYIRTQREHAQVSMRQLARAAGVSNPYLSQIERGLRKPSAEILAQIATGLRISAEVLYVRAGILEARVASPVLDALAGDPGLTERQKQVLSDIYTSFRRENPTSPDPGGNDGSAAIASPAVASPTVLSQSRPTTDQER